MQLEPSQSYVSDAITTDDEDELPSSEINAPTTSSAKFILPEVDEKNIKDISIDITVHDEKPDDVTVAAAGSGTSVGTTVQTESTAPQAVSAGPNGGMIVVNNDVTLETLLSRAQRGEVTLLAQAKEDGTYVLVENTQHDSEGPVEAVSSMQSADSQNAATADIVINNDETQPKSIGS